MAYLSVPSPGKWILDIFGKNIVRRFFDDFWDQHFSKNGPQKGPQRGSPKFKKVRILIL